MTLSTYDLFTDAEMELYMNMVNEINVMNKLDEDAQKSGVPPNKEIKNLHLETKRHYKRLLNEEIAKHAGTPRTVNLRFVLDHKWLKDEDGNLNMPPGITWRSLKTSRRIAEFCSEMSRAMGLEHLDVTLDKIILKWRSPDVLRQIVLDGFIIPILNEDGTVEERKYRFWTASAGQLRTDRIQMLSESAIAKIHDRLMCGMTWEKLNEHGGINVGKYLAYTALPSSSTDEWKFDLDRMIVIPDFEAPVTGMMDYITQEYKIERGIREVMINHCDGVGMAMPGVLKEAADCDNAMMRGPFIKGLLTTFDYIGFCAVNGVPPVITDIWLNEHNLIDENIQVILTASQFKLAKYYKDWEEYKRYFRECGCSLGLMNYEERYIKTTELNYQMEQTLVSFTDEELEAFTKPTYNKIKNLAENQAAMLRTLGADIHSEDAYRRALAMYPELLRDGYSRETIKDIKRRWTLDAMSGAINCQNRRLFAIPDMYAACQFWFMHIDKPEGLLKDGEVYARDYWWAKEADVLRSPHLSFEHAIREFNHDTIVASWFQTGGIYTSCHDLISRILQFDVDGDQLNVVTEPSIISAAKRNMKEMDIVPLFYDANKAPPEILTWETIYTGLKRAHDYSGIGQVSNSITKLWNKPNPDANAAKLLTMYNNYVIDAAKTGFVNSYEDHPESKAIVSKAIGGKTGRMPWFFQFSKNGRHNVNDARGKKKKYLKPNESTMNRIWRKFSTIGRINLDMADVKPFNYLMMLSCRPNSVNYDAVNLFCEMDSSNFANKLIASMEIDFMEQNKVKSYDILAEDIVRELTENYGELEEVYPSIVLYLFTEENLLKESHKLMFWRVFGDIACKNIESNLLNCFECQQCGIKTPNWYPVHDCPKQLAGFVTCCDCGKVTPRIHSRQQRCADCQAEHKRILAVNRKRRQRKKVA